MTIHWILSSAGSGKTTWVVDQARRSATGLLETPRIVVPTQLLVRDIQGRLATRGGAIGVWVGTLGELVQDVLDDCGYYSLALSEIMQRKLLQTLLADLPLDYYRAIKEKPGFVQECLALIRELKSGGITADAYLNAARSVEGGERLVELGSIYNAYQAALQQKGWVDPAGMTWKAAELLEDSPDLSGDWNSIYLDGFDDLSPVQIKFVRALSNQVADCVFTLTGAGPGVVRELVHKRFLRLYDLLYVKDDDEVDFLDDWEKSAGSGPSLVDKLEPRLFEPLSGERVPIGKELELFAVPDRESEVRTALRWIRHKIKVAGIKPGETALLMRSVEPYRSLIHRIAEEYQLPLRILGGLPLFENPAVDGIWRLILMMRSGKQGLIWKEVLSVWRSPYFNWECISSHPDGKYDRGRHLAEMRQLEEVARWGRVIQGFSQWEEAFQILLRRKAVESGPEIFPDSDRLTLPNGEQAAELWKKFSAFVDLVDLPAQSAHVSDFVSCILDLIGESGENESGWPGLGVLANILEGPANLMERDWQAVSAFVDLLKGYAAADQILDGAPIPFSKFADDLEALLRQTSFQPRAGRDEEILCADCTEARGMSFKAMALIGLAEGEFPSTIKEDPLLRDTDRGVLRDEFGLLLQPSTDSAEAEYFYEAMTRASSFLLITRPRIAENGSTWESSPYWEEIERLVNVTPRVMTTQSPVPLELAASFAEYLEFLAVQGGMELPEGKNQISNLNTKLEMIRRAGWIMKLRIDGKSSISENYEGDLTSLRDLLVDRFSEEEVWSASRLENYQTCPFNFYIGNLLGLEKLEPPEEGLDGRQLGNIYHHILEALYLEVGREYQLSDLLAALPSVAERMFREAPVKEGFRENAWWQQTQAEILGNLRLSLAVIEGLAPEYRFHSAEHRFGIGRSSPAPLKVEVPGEGEFRVRGLIDRVDRTQQGKLRIIDYKTAGPGGFDQRAVKEGKKLQLPLYALAAEKALGLGKVSEGFYFHVQAAQASSFQLANFSYQGHSGPQAAMAAAAQQGLSAVRSIRQGKFTPQPPDAGCPSYCPAVDFCWKYQPRFW